MDHECKKEQIIDHINGILNGNGKAGILTRLELLEYRMSKFETEMIKIKACLYSSVCGVFYLVFEQVISKWFN